ncbi:hypothetical protein KFL_004230040 [Klebsormidium nitens]|uniref:U-box domain-containing protein n=1 Tax=Klebsormidium nitens TaxID=105231 RepID=A0A1Y1IH45_KLENI|nr:hypothetical protein KFL_004230040 [Klebsormidium nitens]|eukprot:GAQ88381.1 hypothetical protein KFL_004230040 [Klebsormidium nitens]
MSPLSQVETTPALFYFHHEEKLEHPRRITKQESRRRHFPRATEEMKGAHRPGRIRTRTTGRIPLNLPSALQDNRAEAEEATSLEDDIASALRATQKLEWGENHAVSSAPQRPEFAPGGDGAQTALGFREWPRGFLRSAKTPPGKRNRAKPEVVLKDKQREEASVMETVYKALKAANTVEGDVSARELPPRGAPKPGSVFCELPTGPPVLRKDTREVKGEITGFLNEIKLALEMTTNGPPGGSESLSRDPPSEFVCPLSEELMRDPVLLLETGDSFEKEYIDWWFARGHKTCPISFAPILITARMPNPTLQEQIADWVKLERISPRVELD